MMHIATNRTWLLVIEVINTSDLLFMVQRHLHGFHFDIQATVNWVRVAIQLKYRGPKLALSPASAFTNNQ